MEFDIQRHLTEMETRIRQDIATSASIAKGDASEARDAAIVARTMAEAAILANSRVDGRVTSLEEKASWLGVGVGSLFIGLIAVVWRFITTGKP